MSSITQALLVCLSVCLALAAVSDDHLYCTLRYRRLCQGKGKHVACEFPEIGPGPSCENYTAIKFTDDLKDFITNYINRRRQRIASGGERVRGGAHLPKPEVMMLVEWDRELGQLAQRLADQCRFMHDECRATVRYPYPGQTVGEVRWRKFSDSDELSAQRAIRRVFDAWWGERRRVTPKYLTTPFKLNPRGGTFGHFTQLTVWTLRAVGCAAVRHGIALHRLLLVCDFSHTNMLGQRTIVPGPLKRCPEHTARRSKSPYPLLCGPVQQPTEKVTAVTNRDHEEEQESGSDDQEEEEADDDEDVNVDVADVETSSLGVKQGSSKATHKRIDPSPNSAEYFKFKNKDFDLQEENIKKVPRKDVILEKLDKELQFKKDDHDIKSSSGTVHRKLITKPPIQRHRDDEEDHVGHTKIAYLRKAGASKHSVAIVPVGTTAAHVSRPRWKQPRERPQRPGAKALLVLPTGKTSTQKRKTSVASFILDKEDVDQLFRDTGFVIPKNKSQR